MMARRGSRRPNGAPEDPVRSARIAAPVWDPAKRRAAMEGTTMSAVIHAFVEGYGRGMINVPRTQVVYEAPKPAAVGE